MNKKTILNRTLPLIITLLVILVVAVSVTIFSGAKKTPLIEAPDSEYLFADLGDSKFGYSQKVSITSREVYERLKNGDNGLQFLVNALDKKLLTDKGYVAKVTDEEVKDAVEEAIFGKDFEFETEDFDANMKKIADYIKKMEVSYGIKINKESITISGSELDVKLANEQALKDYYTLVLARKIYTREEMGKDQEESYKEFIEKYEDYLEELHKFNEEEISKAPTAPTDGSIITSTNVQSDYEKENADSFWTLFVTYETKEEAEKALLQVGVVIYNSTWYEYKGIIDLNDYKDANGKNLYTSLSAFYKAEGKKLGQYEITTKLVELYNNSKVNDAEAKLEKGVNYNTYSYTKAQYDTDVKAEDKNKYQEFIVSKAEYEAADFADKDAYSIDELTEEEYNKLDAEVKELYTKDGEKYVAYKNYKAIIFNTTLKEVDGKEDEAAKENALYYTADELTKIDGSIHSYIKSLTAAYAKDATFSKSYTKSIQAKGSYYILGAKFLTIEVADFDEVYGTMYDKEKFEEDGTIGEIGYVHYTVDEEGNKVFDFDNADYWKHVNKLLDDAVSAEKINQYMAELRNDCGLIIYDEKIEAAYMAAYKSDYKATKKSSSTVVAKLAWKNDKDEKVTFEVTANDLFKELDNVFGAITATDAFQYENVLYTNEVIDYAKYKNGASLKNSVIITEYALAEKGSVEPVTAWKKVNTDGEVVFEKVDGTKEYDVIVRKGTDKKDRKVEAEELEYEVEAKEAKTKITVTVSDEPDYLDAEGKFNGLDAQIEALKLYFSNGNFAEYGYDASYGWKNFLRDYFQQYYGIKVESNDDLKLYYIYEDAVKNLTEDLADNTKENWENIYLPYMQQAYDKFFSVDAVHFLIYIQNEDGEMVDPVKDADKWTTAQTNAAKDLYNNVYKILKKTKKSDQAKVMQEIVDAIAAAPRFVDGVALNTAAQKEYIENQEIYLDKNEDGDVIEVAVEYTTTIKGVEIETSLLKTLGIKAKYEDLGTVTADKMVKPFEDALKLMWNAQNNAKDNAMSEGVALETNDLYCDYNGAVDYLATEFGYHVLVANKFTGRPTEKDETDKTTKPVTLPSLDNVLVYEKDGKEVDDLTDFEIAQIKNYYEPVRKEFESSQWYQLNVMNKIVELVENGTIKFTNDANKQKAIDTANYYIENYYKNLNFITRDYKEALNLMKIATEAMKGLANGNNNIEKANMDIILAQAEKVLTAIGHTDGTLNDTAKYDSTEIKDFKEAYDAFVAAKATYNK